MQSQMTLLAMMMQKLDKYRLIMSKDNKEKVEIKDEAKGKITESLRISETEVHHRTFSMRDAHYDEKARTVELAFSSEEPVLRRSMDGVYWEVLGHRTGEMDDEFIASGRAPLLLDHSQDRQIGVVQSVEVSGGVARAKVKLSRSEKGTEILQDIVDGIRGNVSVGYYVREQQEVEQRDGLTTVRATLWTPIEVSMVSIPADQSVGVGRSKDTESLIETENSVNSNDMEERQMSDKNEKAVEQKVDVEAIRAEAAAGEQARVREIAALGSKFEMTREADDFIKNNKSAEDFRGFVLENMDVQARNTKVEQPTEEPTIGLTDKEVRNYSFQKAILAQVFPNDKRYQEDAAFEIEASRAAEKATGKRANGILVPYDVVAHRDLTAGTATTGAELVDDELQPQNFIELLRNNMVVAQMGARMLSGLQGDVSIPRQTGAATAYWINPENSNITAESDQTLDQVQLSPRTLGAYTDFSRQLLLQSSIDVEQMIRDDLAAVLAREIDRAALYGSGAAGQPTGVVTSIVGAKTTFAGAVPTFAEIVELESAVAANNALRGSLGYVTNYADRGSLKTTSKAGTEAIFVHDGESMNGYRAMASEQITSGDVIFGNWNDLLIGMWGSLDLVADPYTGSIAGTTRIIGFQSIDVALRHAESFVLGNDTP